MDHIGNSCSDKLGEIQLYFTKERDITQIIFVLKSNFYNKGMLLSLHNINNIYLLHGRACDIAELLHECINPHEYNNSAM